jgi:glycosyltransferase involved in cell wall biosynthesis
MKIGWIISGTKKIPSARLHGWNLHDHFLKKGIESEVIFSPIPEFNKYNREKKEILRELILSKADIDLLAGEKFDYLILQKINEGDNIDYLLQRCHENGTKIVYIAVDEINQKLATTADIIFVINDYFKTLVSTDVQGKMYRFSDYYEHDGTKFKIHTEDKKITLVYITSKVFAKIPQIDALPENVSMKVIGPSYEVASRYYPDLPVFTDSGYDFEYVEWELSKLTEDILECDVGVVPFSNEHLAENYSITSAKVKSINRPLVFMSLGLPVIVSPVPEYKKIVEDGKNGYIASTTEEWESSIVKLRDNCLLRKEMGFKARETVLDDYSIETQAKKITDVLVEHL